MPPKSRSGAYRMKIGPAKARLLQYVAEAANPIAAYTNVREAKGVESIVDQYFTRVNNTINLVSDSNDKWIRLLTDLDDNSGADELQFYSTAAEGEDGFLAVLDKASEVRDYYQAKLQEVQRAINRFYEAERITATQLAANAAASPMQLPKLKLPTFNGDKLQWPTFWDAYKSAVDDCAIPKNQKFTCLQPLLTDKARKAIEGFLSSDKNYDIMVERLKKRFGNTDSLQNTLEMELYNLPRSGDRAVEVHDTFDQVEQICQQLELLGVNIEHEQIGLTIERKLPKWLLMDVKRAKKADPGWTVKKLCNLINTNLMLQEEVKQDLAVSSQPHQPKTGGTVSKLHVSTFATTTSQKQAQQPTKSCVFCDEMHWFDACPTYKTYQERSWRANDLNQCSRCLKEGHGSSNCSTSFCKPCYYCKQDHASAMCSMREQLVNLSDGQKNGAQKKKGKQQRNTVMTSHGAQHITMAVALQNSSPMAEPPAPINVAANATMHAREDVLLLARQINLQNLSWTQSANVIALFDQGSQLSYITCKLADHLKLQPICKDQLHLSTFGATKMQELSMPRYEIILPLLDGSTKTLIVNALEQLKDNDLPRYISSHHITAPPQILIGADYFYDIVNSTPQMHDSGLHIVQSKVGYLLCGQQGVTTLAAASIKVTRTTEPANEKIQPPSSLDKSIKCFWTLFDAQLAVIGEPMARVDEIIGSVERLSAQPLSANQTKQVVAMGDKAKDLCNRLLAAKLTMEAWLMLHRNYDHAKQLMTSRVTNLEAEAAAINVQNIAARLGRRFDSLQFESKLLKGVETDSSQFESKLLEGVETNGAGPAIGTYNNVNTVSSDATSSWLLSWPFVTLKDDYNETTWFLPNNMMAAAVNTNSNNNYRKWNLRALTDYCKKSSGAVVVSPIRKKVRKKSTLAPSRAEVCPVPKRVKPAYNRIDVNAAQWARKVLKKSSAKKKETRHAKRPETSRHADGKHKSNKRMRVSSDSNSDGGQPAKKSESDQVPSWGCSIFYFMVLACIFNVTAADKCSSIINATRIHSQVCRSSGFIIMQDVNRRFCWTKVNCNKGHIRLEHEVTHSQFCGPKCECPSWAEGCSFYEGKASSTLRLTNEKIKTLLEQEKPDVCAFEKTSGCDHKALYDSFKQIQLYDGSKHFVKALHIAKREVVGDEFECIGNGSVTGTPIFCKHHDCVPDGTRFCYYWNSELATLETEDGNIPIKAWGTVTAVYYESLTHHSLQVECSTCSIDCVQGGVQLNLEEGIGLIEVCSAPVCYQISHPRKQESVFLPADITISQYDITLKLWSQGIMVKQVQRSCPPNAFCKSIKCIFCVELLSNPHCAPMTAVVIIALLAYIGSSALYYTIKLLKMAFSCTSCLGGCLGRGADRIFCGICKMCAKFIRNIWSHQCQNNC